MRRLLIAPLLFLVAAGCAERTLTIRSNPPGAEIWVNGERLEGTTPATVSAAHDGTYRIELNKADYRRRIARFTTESSWSDAFPFDVFTDFLNPFAKGRHGTITIELEPIPEEAEVDDAEVVRLVNEATDLRKKLAAEATAADRG